MAASLPAQQSYIFSTLAGQAGVSGTTDGAGSAARFDRPYDIAIDAAGMLYVADYNNATVRKITPDGVVTTLAGRAGVAGDTDGAAGVAQFRNPEALAVDAAGNVFVADTGNGLIRKISPAGFVTTVAGRRITPGIYAEGAASSLSITQPQGVAVDAAGNLYITHSTQIQKITPAGVVINFAGGVGTPHSFYADGSGTEARFAQPTRLVLDATGTLFVVDSANYMIRKVTPEGAVSTFAGAREPGSNDGVGSAARFGYVGGLAIDRTGSLFVAAGSTLRKILPTAEVITIAGRLYASDPPASALFRGAQGVAVDRAGNLYIADGKTQTIQRGVPTNAPVAPIITSYPYGQNYSVGERAAVTFTVTVSGATPFTYQWARNDVAIGGATGASLTLPSVTATDGGAYSATVTNIAGTQTSQVGSLAVYTPPFGSFTSRHARSGGSFLWSIATGANTLVAVGTEGKILSSSDGLTWTNRVSNTTDWLVGVAYGAGKFVAVGDRGRILVSLDGMAWTNATATATTQRLNNVIYAAGQFVAVGEAGTIVTSSDAQTWTLRPSGVTGWLRGLAYAFANNGNYFAACGQGGAILVSSDGATWTQPLSSLPAGTPPVDRTSDLEAMMPDSVFTGALLCIGQSGAITQIGKITRYINRYNPAQGVSTEWWFTFLSTKNPARIRGLALGAGAVFATGETGTILGAPRVEGPWSVVPAGTTANLVSGIFRGNSLYIVGENETILQSDALYTSRLVNLATRGRVGTEASAMFSGFVVTGSAPKQMLIRAAGPALAAFGLGDTLAAPALTLFDSANTPLGTNTGWDTAANASAVSATATRVGAFPFAAGSADAALLVTLPPGAYTAQIAGRNGTSGLSLVEAYDAETLSNEGSRAINISTRGQVGTGSDRLIAGFVINGAASRRVLIRAIGPSLATFGLTGLLAQPQIQLFHRNGAMIQSAGAWTTQPNPDEIRDAALRAGAFPLDENSLDSAVVVTLLPGQWTVHVSGANGATGLALVEVYDLP